jgi:hypothetical protein
MNNHYNAAAKASMHIFCISFAVTHNDKEVFEGLIKYSVSAGKELNEIEKANMAFCKS